MALDIIGIALIVLFFIRGYMKGIIIAVFSLFAILFGIICALKLSEKLASWLYDRDIITSGWGQFISYLVIFTAAFLLVRFVAKAIESVTKAVALGWLNGLIGGLLYGITAAIAWSSVLWLLNEMHVLKPEMIAASKTYPYLSELAPKLLHKIGVLWPWVKSSFTDLEHFFDHINKNK